MITSSPLAIRMEGRWERLMHAAHRYARCVRFLENPWVEDDQATLRSIEAAIAEDAQFQEDLAAYEKLRAHATPEERTAVEYSREHRRQFHERVFFRAPRYPGMTLERAWAYVKPRLPDEVALRVKRLDFQGKSRRVFALSYAGVPLMMLSVFLVPLFRSPVPLFVGVAAGSLWGWLLLANWRCPECEREEKPLRWVPPFNPLEGRTSYCPHCHRTASDYDDQIATLYREELKPGPR